MKINVYYVYFPHEGEISEIFVYINNCPFHYSSKVLPLPLSMAVIYEHAQTHWAHYVQPEGS